MRTVIPFISTLLYNGALKSSSWSSSGGANQKMKRCTYSNTFELFHLYNFQIPLGITPGSMKVANVKFARTNATTFNYSLMHLVSSILPSVCPRCHAYDHQHHSNLQFSHLAHYPELYSCLLHLKSNFQRFLASFT